jgi:hypothetical protein
MPINNNPYSDDDYLKECFSLFLSYGHFDPRRNGTIDVDTLGEVFRAMGLDPSEDRLTEMKGNCSSIDSQHSYSWHCMYGCVCLNIKTEMIARAGDQHGRGIDETVDT